MASNEEAPATAGAAFIPEGEGVPGEKASGQGSDARASTGGGEGEAEDLEVSILPDGRVQIHARCRPGEDPSQCELRVKALVEALGVPEEAVVREIEGRPE